MIPEFWQARTIFWLCSYYEARSDFISRDSIFKSWVLVAPENGEFAWQTTDDGGRMMTGTAAFGDLVCIAPRRPFFRHITRTLSYYVLQWNFTNERDEVLNVDWPTGVSPVRDTVRLQSTLEQLKPLAGRSDAWSLSRQAHLLEELLHLAWQTKSEPEVTDAAMREAAVRLRERAGENFSMTEISGALGLGPVQFTRRFRVAYGRNPIEFLTQIRLERAQKMLIETDAALDDIAFECGWASGAYLSHVFKKQLHITPGLFRKRHRV
jgi:AraC-like DNA-binding protein